MLSLKAKIITAELMIKDDGNGIKAELASKSYLIGFFMTQKQTAGSGLGLSIAKTLLNFMMAINLNSDNNGTSAYLLVFLIKRAKIQNIQDLITSSHCMII